MKPQYLLVPNLDTFIRDSTDKGLLGALSYRLLQLSSLQLARLVWHQLPYALKLIRRDFTAAMLLLIDIELVSRHRLPLVLLSPSLTDLVAALGNFNLLHQFLVHVKSRYHIPVGFATHNPRWLLPRLGQWRLTPDYLGISRDNRHLIKVHIASNPSLSLIFFPPATNRGE